LVVIKFNPGNTTICWGNPPPGSDDGNHVIVREKPGVGSEGGAVLYREVAKSITTFTFS